LDVDWPSPNGGGPIRIRPALTALVAAAATIPIVTAAEPIVLLIDQQRREVMPVVRGDAEMVPIADLVSGLPVHLAADARGTALTLTSEGRKVVLYDRKTVASIDGDLRLLSSAAMVEAGRWLMPIDSVPRVLAPLLKKKAEWRPAQRVLLVGTASVPRVTVATSVSGDSVRVVLESSEKVPYRVSQETGRVTVAIPRDIIDVDLPPARLTGGIVDLVQYVGGRDNTFAINLGRRFQTLKATEQESPSRLVLDFHGAPLPAAAAPSAGPAAPAAAPSAAAPPPPGGQAAGVRTVVIDPGHGGAEVGAQGPSGTLEKDVTLAIARKLRAAIVNTLGLQAFLTRDKDLEVPLDDRAAFANNYKADLFVSIHANASRASGAKGSEVYFLSYQASDDESRRIAAMEGGVIPTVAQAPVASDVALILWDMAQAEHLEESSTLASRIQEELAGVTGSEGRGVKQAPFRVLVGATMPAVLVEVAFISNAEEEKQLTSDAYQSSIAAALLRGIARYQREHAERLGPASPTSGAVRAGTGPQS
jgi:N-acetylmuramoyl-L-alanine amidase